MVLLVTLHGFSGGLVPGAARLPIKILFAQKGGLDFSRTLGINSLLCMTPPGA